MWPALATNAQMDWFAEWPRDALLEVSSKFLASVTLDDDRTRESVAQVFTEAHSGAVAAAEQMAQQIRRVTYITPAKVRCGRARAAQRPSHQQCLVQYLEFVMGFRSLLEEKRRVLVRGRSCGPRLTARSLTGRTSRWAGC